MPTDTKRNYRPSNNCR